MRRFLMLAAIAAFVIALPLAHNALATPEAKVQLCHVNSSNTPATYVYDSYEWYYGTEYSYHYEYAYCFGNVIEVAASAVDAHLAHGDSTAYYLFADYLPDFDYADYFENWDQNDYYYEWDYRPDYDYYGHYGADYTNGNVKNADCFFYTYGG